MREKLLNYIGGIPDLLMANFPDPTIPRGRSDYEEYVRHLDFYRNWNVEEKPFIGIPDSTPPFEEVSYRPYREGLERLFTYESSYRFNDTGPMIGTPDHETNMRGFFHLWSRDRDKRRPLVLCLHGYGMSGPRRARSMFKIAKLFAQGMDVGLYTMPYHWKRSRDGVPRYFLNPSDIPYTLELVAQAVHDLHSTVSILKGMGHDRIGLIGASLGGYIASLYATFDAPVEFMFFVVPGIDFTRYLDPSRGKFRFQPNGKVRDLTREALKLVSPLTYRPRFDVDRMCTVIHTGDKLAEARYARRWIGEWEIPNHSEVIGGHWLYFDRKTRGRAWYGWLERMGFIRQQN